MIVSMEFHGISPGPGVYLNGALTIGLKPSSHSTHQPAATTAQRGSNSK